MSNQKIRLGFALSGSLCTFDKVIEELGKLALKYDITPIIVARFCHNRLPLRPCRHLRGNRKEHYAARK